MSSYDEMTERRALLLSVMALEYVSDTEPEAPLEWVQAAALIRQRVAQMRDPGRRWFHSAGRRWGDGSAAQRRRQKLREDV